MQHQFCSTSVTSFWCMYMHRQWKSRGSCHCFWHEWDISVIQYRWSGIKSERHMTSKKHESVNNDLLPVYVIFWVLAVTSMLHFTLNLAKVLIQIKFLSHRCSSLIFSYGCFNQQCSCYLKIYSFLCFTLVDWKWNWVFRSPCQQCGQCHKVMTWFSDPVSLNWNNTFLSTCTFHHHHHHHHCHHHPLLATKLVQNKLEYSNW